MVEKNDGALKKLPFRQMIRQQPSAETTIGMRATRIVDLNVRSELHFFKVHKPWKVDEMEELQRVRDDIDQIITPKNLFLTQEKLKELQHESSTITFQQAVEEAIHSAEKNEKDPLYLVERNPGIELIGYFMELLEILDESAASREEAIAVIIDCMRNDEAFGLKRFGVIMHEAVLGISQKLSPKGGVIFKPTPGRKDIMADREGATQFMNTVLKVAKPEDGEIIALGIEEQWAKSFLRIREQWKHN